MRNIRWFYIVTCGPLLAVGLLAFFIRAMFALKSPAELDYGEGIVMWQAAHVTDLKTAYHPVDVYPHIVFHYTPLYHLASRGAAAITGDLLVAGRLVSVLSLAGVCVILALLTWLCLPKRLGLSRIIAAASAGLLPFTLPVWGWATFMRVDTLAMLFSMAGIALFILAQRRPFLVYPAFLLFVAAVYTKQIMISAPAACFLLLLLESPKRALKAALVVLVSGLSALAYLQMATDGMFFRNIFTYNQNPFTLGRLQRMWIEYASGAAVVLVAAVALPVAYLFVRPQRLSSLIDRTRRLTQRHLSSRAMIVAVLTLVIAFVVSATVGKEGSNYNYFFELDLAASLAAGLFIGWLLADRPPSASRAHGRFAVFATAMLALHSAITVKFAIDARYDLRHPRPHYSEELVQVLKALPGPVYSENMTLLMQAGKEVPAEPMIISSLARSGMWDESGFVKRIEDGFFSAILLNSDRAFIDLRFTPAIQKAIESRYVSRRTFGAMTLLEPRR